MRAAWVARLEKRRPRARAFVPRASVAALHVSSRWPRASALVRAAVVVLGCTLEATSARAQAPAPTSAAAPSVPRRVVEVVFAGPDDASLDDTVRELLDRLGLAMESRGTSHFDTDDATFRSTSRPSLLARVGIDLRDRDVAVATVVDGRTGDVAVRRSLRRDSSAAVMREELALVVQSAVDPMMLAERDRAAAEAHPSSPPAAPASPEPPPPRSSPAPSTAASSRDVAESATESSSPLALDLSTMAGAGAFASGAGPIARAGGGAALVWRRGVRPSLGVSAHYVFPFETGSDVALAHVGIASLRAAAAIEVYGSQAFALDAAAGFGADILHVEPRSNALPASYLGPPTSRVDPVATASVTGHLSIGSGTSLSLMIAADVDMASRHWVVDSGDLHEDAFAPSRLRPLAMLGFTFTPFGESRFGTREASR
jgi:hypothetical protein